MSSTKSRITRIVTTAAILVGMPAIANATTFLQNFNTSGMQIGIAYSYPSNKVNDVYLNSTKAGKFTTDVTNCPSRTELAAYNTAAIKRVAAFPDSIVLRFSAIPYCDPVRIYTGLSLPSGYYHYNVLVTYYPQSVGYGFDRLES